MEVKLWLDALKIGQTSKARIRPMISMLLDRAMLWEYIKIDRNPTSLRGVAANGAKPKTCSRLV